MLTKFIAKLLGKKIYKSEIILTSDDFTAHKEDDCMLSSLKWIIAGLYESGSYISNEVDSTKSLIIGKLSEFKLFSISQSSVIICGYTKPTNEELMFLTNNMVYIPDRIVNNLRKHEVDFSKIDKMFK